MSPSSWSRNQTSPCNENTRGPLLPRNFVCKNQPERSWQQFFWDTEGVLLLEFIPRRTTITRHTYASRMVALKENIKQKRCGNLSAGVLLLHVHTLAQMSRKSRAAIMTCGFVEFYHPPYSPGLAPSDYFLFSNLNNICVGDYFPMTMQSSKL